MQEGAGPLFQDTPSCPRRSESLRLIAPRLRSTQVISGLPTHTPGKAHVYVDDARGGRPPLPEHPLLSGTFGEPSAHRSAPPVNAGDLGITNSHTGQSPCLRRPSSAKRVRSPPALPCT